MTAPVFVIGGSRTGSELLKSLLGKHSEFAFVNEMHLLSPWWLHEDFSTVIRKELGAFGPELSGASIIALIKRGRCFGYFWDEFSRVIDEKRFCETFDATGRQLKDVLEVSMQMYAEAKGKSRIGAKFPVHYSFADKLLEWYPDCRIIHTVRDPRAIYASQSVKYAKSAKGRVAASITKFVQFAHVNIQTKWTYKVHERLSGGENYHLAVYEELIGNTESYFESLCEFLDIEFVHEMVNPTAFRNSSFDISRGKSQYLQKEALDAYRKVISPLSIKMIELINRKEMRALGYI